MKKLAVTLNIAVIIFMILTYVGHLFDTEISRLTAQVQIEKTVMQALIDQ